MAVAPDAPRGMTLDVRRAVADALLDMVVRPLSDPRVRDADNPAAPVGIDPYWQPIPCVRFRLPRDRFSELVSRETEQDA